MNKFPCGCFPLANVLGASKFFPDLENVSLFDLTGARLGTDAFGPGVTVKPGLKLLRDPCDCSPYATLDNVGCTLHISDANRMCCLKSGHFALCDFWAIPLLFMAKTPSMLLAPPVEAVVESSVAAVQPAEADPDYVTEELDDEFDQDEQ